VVCYTHYNNNSVVIHFKICIDDIRLSVLGIACVALAQHHQVKGGVFLGICIISLLDWLLQNEWPSALTQWPPHISKPLVCCVCVCAPLHSLLCVINCYDAIDINRYVISIIIIITSHCHFPYCCHIRHY
jgi:xanthine/uracil/vitamin C permease (AzgA family)